MNLKLIRLSLITLTLITSAANAADYTCSHVVKLPTLSLKAFDLQPVGEAPFGAKHTAVILKTEGANHLLPGTVTTHSTRVGKVFSYTLKGGALGEVTLNLEEDTILLPGNCTRAGCGPAVSKTITDGTLSFLGESHEVSCVPLL